MRPASVSPDCLRRSTDAEPSSRKRPAFWPLRRPRSISPRRFLEQARQPMDLVENDQLVPVLGEIELRLGKSGAVGIGLEVKIDGGALPAYGERKRRLADLPRPDEGNGGHAVEQFVKVGCYAALDHPCIYGAQFQNCKDKEWPRAIKRLSRRELALRRLGRSNDDPRCAPEGPLGVVVVAGRLLHRAVLRLLHGFGQGNAAAGGLGKVAGAQAVGGKLRRIEPGLGDAALEDQIDRLRGQRPAFADAPQRSMPRNTAPSVIFARSSHSRKATTGRPTSSTTASISASVVLVRPSWIFVQGSFGPSGSFGSAGTGILVDQLFDPQGRNFAAATAAGGKGRQQKRAVANVDQAIAGAGLEQGGRECRRSPPFCSFWRAGGRWHARRVLWRCAGPAH